MDWGSIQYVTSGLTLVAFVALVVGSIVKVAAGKKKALIETAPEGERARLVEQELESYHIDTTNLTRAQRHELVTMQLRLRNQRYRLTVWAALIALVIFAVLTGYTIAQRETIPEVTLSGVIKDPEQDPVSGATVTVEGRDFVAESGGDGAFRGMLDEVMRGDVLTVQVMHDGYHHEVRQVAASGPSVNLHTVRLRPAQ